MTKQQSTKAISADDDRPVVKVHIKTFEHPNALRMEILILGADEATRSKVEKSIKEAIDYVAGS